MLHAPHDEGKSSRQWLHTRRSEKRREAQATWITVTHKFLLEKWILAYIMGLDYILRCRVNATNKNAAPFTRTGRRNYKALLMLSVLTSV